MNTALATVVATGASLATVSVETAIACARCASGRGCGAGLMQKGRTRVLQVEVADGLRLEAGDVVRLELRPERLLRAAWLAYGLPLFCMVAGTGIAFGLAAPGDDTAALVAGTLGLLGGVFAGRRVLGREKCLRSLVPIVAARVGGVATSRADVSSGAVAR